MNDILPYYGLKYEKVTDEQKLKEYIKIGTKCLASFSLNKKEWENFYSYFNDCTIKSDEKLLTKEIIEKPINGVNNPDEKVGHTVVLKDIERRVIILSKIVGEKTGDIMVYLGLKKNV